MRYRESVRSCALIGVLLGLGPLLSPFSWPGIGPNRHPSQTNPPAVQEATIAAPAVPITVAPAPAPSPPAAAPARPESVLAQNQMVVFYGSPISSGLGILGVFPPDEAARRVRDEAAIYDRLNGDRGVRPAIDLIYEGVTAEPTPDGLFLSYVGDSTVQMYLDLAEQYDLQLILDLQIGRSTALDEVRKLEPYLRNPRVHVAIDPEYAVGPDGWPLVTPGRISGDEINAVQDYLSWIAAAGNLPPKMLVIHQWKDDTVVDGGVVRTDPNVNLVLNMDAFGEGQEKRLKYEAYASQPYAQHRSFNIFLHYDEPVLSEEQALALQPSPDVIFYQ